MNTNNKLYETCKRCGRRLKSEKSQKRGYGDYCARKAKADQEKQLSLIEGVNDGD